MKIIDEKLLDTFREVRRCQWCHKAILWPDQAEPHHIMARGMGGGGRLDVALNIAALCWRCHRSHHDGHMPRRRDLIALVAAREGLTPNAVQEELWRLLRTPKEASHV